MTVKWHLKHAIHGNKPWAVQREALNRSEPHDKYGQFLEQGLGKTGLTQNQFIAEDDTDLHIVVAPNSFKNDWVLAPEEWGVGWMPTGYWPKHPLPFDAEYMQYAINYEAARQGAFRDLCKLFERRRVRFTIDESTALKNHNSTTTKQIIELAKRADKVWLLNGTPLVENAMDYYGQLRAIGRLNGVNPTNFKNRYAVVGGFMGKQLMPEIRNEEELAGILDECSFRALKKDWRKDLPPKIYKPLHLEMTDKQRAHYAEMMEEFITIVNGDEITATLVLTQMDKLRQISSCVAIQDGRYHFIEDDRKNPKLQALFDVIAGTQGKIIVSYHYRPTGMMLYEAMKRAKLNPAVIRGGMKPEDLSEQKRMFNDDSSCRIILGQQLATCRGHTLIGQSGRDRCSTLYFFENSFSYYQRSQMEDRNNRGAQDQDCLVIDPITSPMDGIAVNALTRKKGMANSMDDVVAAVRAYRP